MPHDAVAFVLSQIVQNVVDRALVVQALCYATATADLLGIGANKCNAESARGMLDRFTNNPVASEFLQGVARREIVAAIADKSLISDLIPFPAEGGDK